jgi:hypothetical protein
MNAEHEITEGPVTLNENGLEMSFRALDASGHDAPWRVEGAARARLCAQGVNRRLR